MACGNKNWPKLNLAAKLDWKTKPGKKSLKTSRKNDFILCTSLYLNWVLGWHSLSWIWRTPPYLQWFRMLKRNWFSCLKFESISMLLKMGSITILAHVKACFWEQGLKMILDKCGLGVNWTNNLGSHVILPNAPSSYPLSWEIPKNVSGLKVQKRHFPNN